MSTRSAAELYGDDLYAWTQVQAKELRRFARTRPNLPLDLPHIAEEIADLGTELRSRLRSWTRRIIEHLLLLEHSPAPEPRRDWIVEIVNFRREISDHLTGTLRRDLKRQLPRLYEEVRATCRRSLRPLAKRTLPIVFQGAAPIRSTKFSRLLARLERLKQIRAGDQVMRSAGPGE